MEEGLFTYKFYKTTVEAWEAMYEAISSASKSIYWEVYIFVDDEIGKKFVSALAAKAKAGVEVKLIIDAFGSSGFSEESEKICRDAGVDVLKYNPLYPEFRVWKWIYRLLYRNHRKVLIIDNKTVFLGGVNVQANFKNWDDLYIRLSGHVSRLLLRGFARSYISSGGKKENVRHLLHPRLQQALPLWKEKLRFVVHSPTTASISKSRQIYLSALGMAKDTVNLLTPYYSPDRQFLKAIAAARKRGVKVNIFLPLRSDSRIMEFLARAFYDLTYNAGANIYLLPKMNHGKAMSVDNKMGMVGSINLTNRSFTHQEESAVTFTDEQMVNELNVLFNNMKSGAEQFNIDLWKKRGFWDRFREWVVKKIESFV